MTTDNKTLAVDVLAAMDEMYRALPPVKSDGPAFVMNWEMERRQQAYENVRVAVAELIEAAESIADHYDMDGYGATAWKSLALEMADKARTALARVKGESA